jgi:hypothetical protein
MSAESRAEATARVTRLAFGWLWHKRKCRVIADEIGAPYHGHGLLKPMDGGYRYDLAGAARMGGTVEPWRFDVVEVKGTSADARREDMGKGKWMQAALGERPFNYWLIVDELVKAEDYEGLPPVWGVVRCRNHAVVLERKPAGGGDIRVDHERAARALFALAYRTTTSGLPFMGKSPLDAARLMVAEEERLKREEQTHVEGQVQETQP